MKKWIFLLVFLLLLPIPVRAAEAPYADIWELMEEGWQAEGQACYPDYLTGLWSSDGSREAVTIGLVEGTDPSVVLSQLRDTEGLTIVYQTYSWNELLGLQEVLEGYARRYLLEDVRQMGLGVYVRENRLVVEFHESEREKPVVQAFCSMVEEAYPRQVDIRFTDGVIQFTDHVLQLTPGQAGALWQPRKAQPMALLVMASLAMLLLSLWLRRQQAKLLNIQPLWLLQTQLECPETVDRRLEETLGLRL